MAFVGKAEVERQSRDAPSLARSSKCHAQPPNSAVEDFARHTAVGRERAIQRRPRHADPRRDRIHIKATIVQMSVDIRIRTPAMHLGRAASALGRGRHGGCAREVAEERADQAGAFAGHRRTHGRDMTPERKQQVAEEARDTPRNIVPCRSRIPGNIVAIASRLIATDR